MLPHEDNVLNKFRICKERHIQMRENRSSHLVGWKTHPTILPRSGSNSRPPAHRGVNMINVSYALTTRPLVHDDMKRELVGWRDIDLVDSDGLKESQYSATDHIILEARCHEIIWQNMTRRKHISEGNIPNIPLFQQNSFRCYVQFFFQKCFHGCHPWQDDMRLIFVWYLNVAVQQCLRVFWIYDKERSHNKNDTILIMAGKAVV